MTTTIYLVRHAEVENPKKLIYGRLGWFSLSKRGFEQATTLGEHFKDKDIKIIYSSPLLRTRQTSRLISNGIIPIKFSRLLIEAGYKKWEGKTFASRPQNDVKIYLNTPSLLRAGETVEQIQKRMLKAINMVLKRHPNKNVIIVSHADPILAARMYYENRPLDDMAKITIKKASITSLVFNKELECKEITYKEVVEAEEDMR